MQSLILFDLDGTLIDSRRDLTRAVDDVRGELGLAELSVATVTGFVGNGVVRLAERAFAGVGTPIDDLVRRIRAAYRERMLEQTGLYPGVEQALTDLGDMGYPMAVVTNKPREFVGHILEHLGLGDCFASLVGGDSCAELKPSPAPLLMALREAGAGVAGSWMVGDNYTDLEAARRAGMRSCFCAYGFGERRGETSDLTVGSLAEFAAAVRSWRDGSA